MALSLSHREDLAEINTIRCHRNIRFQGGKSFRDSSAFPFARRGQSPVGFSGQSQCPARHSRSPASSRESPFCCRRRGSQRAVVLSRCLRLVPVALQTSWSHHLPWMVSDLVLFCCLQVFRTIQEDRKALNLHLSVSVGYRGVCPN